MDLGGSCWSTFFFLIIFVRSVMRHGAKSERHHVPRAIWMREVIRLLIVGSNPTLTSGRSVSSVGRAIHLWTCHWFESFTDLFFLKYFGNKKNKMKRLIQKIMLWYYYRFPKKKRKNIWDL